MILLASKVRWLTFGAAESRSTVPLVVFEPPSTIAAPLPGKPAPAVQLPGVVQAALPALPLQIQGASYWTVSCGGVSGEAASWPPNRLAVFSAISLPSMIQPKFVAGLSSHCCTSVNRAELAVLDQEKD